MHPKTFTGDSFDNLDMFIKILKRNNKVKIVSFSEVMNLKERL